MSAPAVDSYRQLPHRKPAPIVQQQYQARRPSHGSSTMTSQIQPPQQPAPYNAASGTLNMSNRRTLSNATTSSTSTSSLPRQSSSSIRRSGSNRSSTTSSTSYTSLMRRQKATVWCDRAQAEDPRFAAAQRLAKERAQREVSGAFIGASGRALQSSGNGSFTGGVARKIRHHGVSKTNTYKDGNMAGAGVPMRLSASEVEDEDASPNEREWEKDGWTYSGNATAAQLQHHHHRTPSGRSSLGSGQRILAGPSGLSNPNLRMSTSSSTPSSHHSRSPSEAQAQAQTHQDTADKTPMPNDRQDYFEGSMQRTRTTGSNSSGETREAGFGDLGSIPVRTKPVVEEKKYSADELRRRGSVDDRAMTMNGGVRLFVANPDRDSDSD